MRHQKAQSQVSAFQNGWNLVQVGPRNVRIIEWCSYWFDFIAPLPFVTYTRGTFNYLISLLTGWIFSYLYSIVSSLWLCDFLIGGKGFAIMVYVWKRSGRNWVVWHAPCQAGSILRYKYTHYQRNISAQLLTADKSILNIYLDQAPRN